MMTPGPWDYDQADWPIIINGPEDGDSNVVAIVYTTSESKYHYKPEEAEANARAIAALPDLINALKFTQAALNTAPRFKIPSLERDSYAVASIVDAALKRAGV